MASAGAPQLGDQGRPPRQVGLIPVVSTIHRGAKVKRVIREDMRASMAAGAGQRWNQHIGAIHEGTIPDGQDGQIQSSSLSPPSPFRSNTGQ